MCDRENNVSSVFKGGNNQPTRQHFTEAWIKMINGIERGKDVTTSCR